MKIPFNQAHFLTSVPTVALAPPDSGTEVAFAGRSNAGKSSALNTLTGQKALARTSKTPGRTQQINFFSVTDRMRLVDLPGYGYAKVPLAMKQQWQHNLADYLQHRGSLRGLILLMDCRHPLTEHDRHLLSWCTAAELPVHILLTKADKLKRGPASSSLLGVRKLLPEYHPEATVQLFSSLKFTGIDEAREVIAAWLSAE